MLCMNGMWCSMTQCKVSGIIGKQIMTQCNVDGIIEDKMTQCIESGITENQTKIKRKVSDLIQTYNDSV